MTVYHIALYRYSECRFLYALKVFYMKISIHAVTFDFQPFGSATLVALQQRTWLIHWSLFVFFNHAKGPDLLIEMFLFQQQ